MITILEGHINNLIPSINCLLNNEGNLVLIEDGEIPITVDTGFSGGISIPENVLEKMNVQLIDYEKFRLATGDEVELPVFWGKVIIYNNEIETWFVPGDFLLGMEFLSLVASKLNFDFNNEKVLLLK